MNDAINDTTFAAASRRRDQRLRRKLLNTLQLSQAMSPRGGLSGRTLVDCVDGAMPAGQKFEGDDHALRLVREMVAKGFFAEEPLPRRRGQRFGLDYLFFKITAKGVSLWNESIAPDPDVDDERLTDDA